MNSIGVDIGGTFTDLVGYRDGQLVISKTLTTPANPTQGVATALELAGTRLVELEEFLHGSTIAINTVLERKGALTALLTTHGFRDVYEIARGNRPDAFDIGFQRPEPLVPRHLRFEVNERLNAKGEVLTPIDEETVRALGSILRDRGIVSIAVCFLHSYANPVHEVAAGKALREVYPELFVTLSHEILREFREYERTSTTVLNAYVGPRVANYLKALENHLESHGFDGAIHIMRSNGGSMSLAHASVEPVSTMESGPVAGMIGAGAVAKLLGLRQAIGFDMGGTTAKATLITDGVPGIEEGYYIGGYATGQPMQLPVVAIVEVGTGGGSIAWRDGSGGLHVGPQSAGSDPGPVCYGNGGTEPTITDANLLLGRLNPKRFLGGGMALDQDGASQAMKRIGACTGLTTDETALGVVRIADSAMALAVRAVSVRKGVDPRDATMIAFGGAGPVHAAALCKEIYIPTLVIPKLPGNFSALGMLLAPWRQDWVRTLVGVLGKLDAVRVRAGFDELMASARGQLAADELDPKSAIFELGADLRYRGQEHTIPVPLPSAEALVNSDAVVTNTFHALHDMRYGHAATAETIEVANLRLTVTVPRGGDSVEEFLAQPFVPEEARPEQSRLVIFDDAECPVPSRILWRPGLPSGFTVEGPAVIEEPNSTTVLFPGDAARVTEHGHLVISIHLPTGDLQ